MINSNSAKSAATTAPLMAEASLGAVIAVAFIIVFSMQTVAVFA